MSIPPLVHGPATYISGAAIAFGAFDEPATAVDAAHPLPTRMTLPPASAPPLAGTTAAASSTPGPFVPELGRPIRVLLSGTWAGSVQLLRSTDGGATRLPITYGDGTPKALWTTNLNAAVTEESVAGASYYLAIALSSGSLSYRVEQ